MGNTSYVLQQYKAVSNDNETKAKEQPLYIT